MTKKISYNILIGAVSAIVALNLGLAMGILSGRDGFLGMISAGIIAVITSAFGGARVSGSGPTAPMSAVTAVIFAHAFEQGGVGALNADQFLNFVLFLTAGFLAIFAFLKVGRFISYVPNLIISGFMTGIALIIWKLQVEALFFKDGTVLFNPAHLSTIGLAVGTILVAFIVPPLLKKTLPKIALFFPGTFVSLVSMTGMAHLFHLPVEYLNLTSDEMNIAAWISHLPAQWPHDLDKDILITALPFAVELALLCYLDTLLTLLVVERMTGEKANRSKELGAQGLAMASIGLIGGVPGAQSTVPSVLLLKEGATSRWAGIAMGVFALLGVLLLSGFIQYIPMAVIIGILFKVGWNVFDGKPFQMLTSKHYQFGIKELSFVVGTALMTLLVDLILAVALFTALYHISNKTIFKDKKLESELV